MICNGIQDVNYQVTENGKYDFLEGQDAMNNSYYPNIDWVMPNGWLAGEWVTDAIENYGEQMNAYNNSAKESPSTHRLFPIRLPLAPTSSSSTV